MNIILLGYMGSGKSTLGRKLAEILNYPFIDLDDYIENREEKSIPELFSERGEIYFRKKEHDYLKEVLTQNNNVILALGGGTPCYANNMDLIKAQEQTTSVYFRAAIPELVKRLKHERDSRPLLSRFETDDALTEFIGKHLFERSPFYNQADLTIDVSNTNEIAVLDTLMQQLVF